ncbi:MAG: DUF4384 domain-containing protein [Candidatus Cloacimonetes bacterium]|nr:DUF4384 domain-containing protein [Candidatus Cloacimonadota bacterium]
MDKNLFDQLMQNWLDHQEKASPEIKPTSEHYQMLRNKVPGKTSFFLFSRHWVTAFSALLLIISVTVLTQYLHHDEEITPSTSSSKDMDYEGEKKPSKSEIRQESLFGSMSAKKEADMAIPQQQIYLQYQTANSNTVQNFDLQVTQSETLTPEQNDSYRLFLEPVRDSYLYVFQISDKNEKTQLFPNPYYNKTSNPVPAVQPLHIPERPQWIKVESGNPPVQILVILSEEPLIKPDDLLAISDDIKEDPALSDSSEELAESPARAGAGLQQNIEIYQFDFPSSGN